MRDTYVAFIGEGEGFYKDKYKAAKAIRDFTGRYIELTRSRYWGSKSPFMVVWDGWRTMWIGSYSDYTSLCNSSTDNVIVVSKNMTFVGAIQ